MTNGCYWFQLKVLQQVEGSSYAPLKDLTIGGIIMVRHVKPGIAEELVEPVAGKPGFVGNEVKHCSLQCSEISSAIPTFLTFSYEAEKNQI